MVGHTLHAWQAIGLRILLVIVVYLAFVNLVGPVSTWAGQVVAESFRQNLITVTATPSPRPSG